MLLASSVIAFGQFTPQRINFQNQEGVFFTLKQEEMLLKAMVELDACKRNEYFLNQNVKSYEIRLHDKDLAINKLQEDLLNSRELNDKCLKVRGEQLALLDKQDDNLAYTKAKLAKAHKTATIAIGTSVIFLGTTVLALLK